MKSERNYYFLCLVFLTSFFVVVGAAENKWRCDGSMAKCGEIGEEEFSMESESTQRIVGEVPKYISPGALRGDLPACGKTARGDPYSKTCLPPRSNSYQRGCSKYYRCRG
ncbi:protein RALF-like 32 [Mangifera indica]|uniref:protein RALF-like 32 n=1 Tax=Mangifera indica TaxID=29780 RepID=UPI001CFA32C8|nr:protein RALF-like 32 [Mangifera indica]